MGFILAIILVIRIVEATDHLPRLAASFADDLLCLPLVLGLVLEAHRRLVGQGSQYTLPRVHGLLVLLLFSIYFEVLLPSWKAAAVGDPWDILMYFTGYLFFEVFMNRPQSGVDTLVDNGALLRRRT